MIHATIVVINDVHKLNWTALMTWGWLRLSSRSVGVMRMKIATIGMTMKSKSGKDKNCQDIFFALISQSEGVPQEMECMEILEVFSVITAFPG